ADAVLRILDRGTALRSDLEPCGRLEVDVRGRLAVCHFLRGNGRPEELLRTGELEKEVDQRPVRGGGDTERPARADTPDRLDRAVDERQLSSVELRQALDALFRDPFRRVGQADHVVHVPRPLGRAHAHHRPLGVGPPVPATLLRDLAPSLVPELLGVEEDAVEVEDDRLDHVYARRRRTRASRPGPRCTEPAWPTKSVWSPTSRSNAIRHSTQPSAPSISGAPSSPTVVSIPVQCAIGGTPRAKC